MARVYLSGFEMDSLSANVEWTTAGTGQALAAGSARTGGWGLKISSLTSATAQGVNYKFVTSTSPGPFFLRTYLNIQTLPSASNDIMAFNSTSATLGLNPQAKITLESNGTLKLRNQAGTAIGSASAALSTGTWYMIELKTDTNATAGSRVMEARLDGSVFATSSTQSHASPLAFTLGGNLDSEAQTTGEWWFDDVAINDNTGSFQTSYPGPGKIIQLLPNAQGDVNGFSILTGGTAGAANNYTRVRDVPTDGNTTSNGSNTLNAEDLFKLTASGIGSNDAVSVVAVGLRLRDDTLADAALAVKAEIEKTAAGTIAQGSSLIIGQNNYGTNGGANPHNYTLTTYQDPDGANWTQATLDTMQIGYKLTATGTQNVLVTTAWATVEYVPGGILELALLGVG